ncbi:uncharacterized protein PG986_009790 [Apiospora aurea]|uniref:NADH dehydrogenase [ubiquinone] 1 alpha subcomplex subunit n=1 Tax=Apiospora aurea TaxID=335848 RepID=A0ABR1Q8P3_9PEZI
MSSSNVGLVMRAWFRWKSLRLPWRKRFLAPTSKATPTGSSASPATRPPPTSADSPAYQSSADDTRWRRIVKYPRSTHYSDVQVPPQWHQWLRYQRQEPPSIAEQQADVIRRQRMKVLAAEADARWAAKPSYLDQPQQQQLPKIATTRDDAQPRPSPAINADTAAPAKTAEQEKKKQEENDPWKKAATGPSETWQPAPWSPSSSRKR